MKMKQFLIVGSINAAIYKEVFPYIKSREVHYRPQCYGIKCYDNIDVKAVATWYTTMETPYIPPLVLTKNYNPDDYPKYDNYDAINVDRTINIPYDYQGVIGVSLTFLDKYCPNQFEIVGLLSDNRCGYPFINGTPMYTDEKHKNSVCGVLNGKRTFARILIRHRKQD